MDALKKFPSSGKFLGKYQQKTVQKSFSALKNPRKDSVFPPIIKKSKCLFI